MTHTGVGEMLVGPKKTLFMDEISTGLDSSTTFQIVKCMGDFVHLRDGTVLMSLLQPAPEVYNLFDDILLLSEGETTPSECRSFAVHLPSIVPYLLYSVGILIRKAYWP